jgi:PAS domain S-box-containing protein
MDSSIDILHVEDDPDFASLTADFLEIEDDRFTVSAATDSNEGLERLAAEEFDCIVSDYDMPEDNGIEFLSSVRERNPDIPFILFTGKGSEEVASEAISAGVTDYLQKDIGSEQYELLANRIVTAVEQYRTEHELERQNDLFSKAQNIASVGAWEYNLDTYESYVSDEVMRIHGLDRDATLLPEESIEYYHPDDRAAIRTAFREALEAGESYDLELRLVDADGQQRWVRTRGEPQTDDGEIVRLRGILQDISEQKRREKRLERQSQRLEEFANVVSHDIRNPLQVASRQLELAEETGDASNFKNSKEALDRISTIIENILTLARHGRTVDELGETKLATVAREAWTTVQTGEQTMKVDDSGVIDADPDRLRQLFENLFHNAVDHAGEETTIRVGSIEPMFTSTRATGEAPTGFYVEDDGPGIPEDQREKVLESGFSTAEEGTGFGLAIVAQIAEAHGWEVRVTEGHSGGARFEFTEQNAPDISRTG